MRHDPSIWLAILGTRFLGRACLAPDPLGRNADHGASMANTEKLPCSNSDACSHSREFGSFPSVPTGTWACYSRIMHRVATVRIWVNCQPMLLYNTSRTNLLRVTSATSYQEAVRNKPPARWPSCQGRDVPTRRRPGSRPGSRMCHHPETHGPTSVEDICFPFRGCPARKKLRQRCPAVLTRRFTTRDLFTRHRLSIEPTHRSRVGRAEAGKALGSKQTEHGVWHGRDASPCHHCAINLRQHAV